MSKATLRPDVLDKIKALTLQNMRQTKIGETLGLSRTAVYLAQKQAGLHARQPLPDETEKQILQLLQSGMGMSKIGRTLGTNKYQAKLIAKKFGIRRAPVQKRAAKKPKANPKIRGHITAAEKTEIRRLTLAGTRQSVIARTLHITAPTVSKIQRSMGLPTHIVIDEKKIMELFEKGWAGYKIARELHTPANRVFAVAHKNNFHREDKAGWKTPMENERKFIEALKRREGYIRTLAKKYGMASCRARKIAHEILGTIEFRPGASKPPLSSNFPQKHFDVKMGKVN
jgi:predicted transcriptional regulator